MLTKAVLAIAVSVTLSGVVRPMWVSYPQGTGWIGVTHSGFNSATY